MGAVHERGGNAPHSCRSPACGHGSAGGPAEPAEQLRQLATHTLEPIAAHHVARPGPGHDHEVVVVRKIALQGPEGLSQRPLDGVALHRTAHAPAHRHTQPGPPAILTLGRILRRRS